MSGSGVTVQAAVILFWLVIMRMSGAIAFHPLFGRTNIPNLAKAAFVFVLSLAVYIWGGAELDHYPVGVVDFALMALKELLVGFVFGFGMELAVLVVRFAASLIDFSMGLSMAQIYDPQSGTQMTISTGLYYNLFMLLFLSLDGHVRFLEIVIRTSEVIPYGGVVVQEGLPQAVLQFFTTCIVYGMQIAMPVVGIELVSEAAIGILMRIVPQINVFAVNFQIKIIVGLVMILLMFTPVANRLLTVYDAMFDAMYSFIGFLH